MHRYTTVLNRCWDSAISHWLIFQCNTMYWQQPNSIIKHQITTITSRHLEPSSAVSVTATKSYKTTGGRGGEGWGHSKTRLLLLPSNGGRAQVLSHPSSDPAVCVSSRLIGSWGRFEMRTCGRRAAIWRGAQEYCAACHGSSVQRVALGRVRAGGIGVVRPCALRPSEPWRRVQNR